MEKIEKTFKITTSPEIMKRIERFFALLHWNSRFGHSGIFAMSLDGDGSEGVTVNPKPEHKYEVDKIGSVGYDVEIVCDNGYHGLFKDKNRKTSWMVQQVAALYKNGDIEDLNSLSPLSLNHD